MFNANIRVGDGFQPLEIYRKTGEVSTTGRAQSGNYAQYGERIWGMIMNASQTEKEQWKQAGHPVSHKILQYGSRPSQAESTDVIKAVRDNREYYVQGRKDPMQLGVATIYYVEERLDIKELS